MSLALAFYNHHGIIMCADKLITATYNRSGINYEIHQSSTEDKLFLIENQYGLSYAGTASIDNGPISAVIEKYIKLNPLADEDPLNWLLILATYFKNKMKESDNTIFTLCGYYHGERIMISSNTKNPEINIYSGTAGITYSGENDYVSHLISSDLVHFDYTKFTMQDSIDFLRFVVSTVSGLMRFGQCLQTVSDECNILAIHPNEAYWVQHSILH